MKCLHQSNCFLPAIIAWALLAHASAEESKDPFGGSAAPPIKHDAKYYAKRASEDLSQWRAFLKKCGEPDLQALKNGPEAEVYRFVFRPWFRKQLLVTMRKTKGKPVISVRRMSEQLTTELKGQMEVEAEALEYIRDQLSDSRIRDPLGHLTPIQRDAL